MLGEVDPLSVFKIIWVVLPCFPKKAASDALFFHMNTHCALQPRPIGKSKGRFSGFNTALTTKPITTFLESLLNSPFFVFVIGVHVFDYRWWLLAR